MLLMKIGEVVRFVKHLRILSHSSHNSFRKPLKVLNGGSDVHFKKIIQLYK